MSDENTLAATPDDTQTEAPVNDGIIDLDAQPEVKDEPEGDEDKKPEPEKAGDQDAGEDGKKKPSGSARERLRNARLAEENADLQRRLDEATRSSTAKPAGESDDKPPREEDFNGDYFAFQRALTAHEAGVAASKAIEKQFQTREQSERSKQQTEIARERDVAHLERVEDAREVIADFDKTMEGMKGVNVRNDVIEEIKASENSALLAYHLAKNPDKLEALNSMSGRELAREMGRLEATVKLPEAKKATTAPAPLSAVKGGASPSSADADLSKWLKKTYG